jgi:hypothetical protein
MIFNNRMSRFLARSKARAMGADVSLARVPLALVSAELVPLERLAHELP